MSTRRTFLTTAALAALSPRIFAAPTLHFRTLPTALAAFEKSAKGRLGVAVLDLATGERIGHRTNERFAMCSTFKTLLAGAVLERADRGHEHLDRTLTIPPKPLVSHSPVTEPHAGGSMTIKDLLHAILTQSDNTAANLLLSTIGGPSGMTRFARSIGDPITRLDRTETTLNDATPGDPRDTSSPDAMLDDLRRILLGDVLSKPSRAQLTQWMIENTYGETRLRAALPSTWRAADKTGANGDTTNNDVAIYFPPNRAPILVTAFLTECPGTDAQRSAVLAEVGRLIITSIEA